MSKKMSKEEILQTLKEIREARKSGADNERLQGALDATIEKLDALTAQMANDPVKEKAEEEWQRMIDDAVEKQLEERWKAEREKFGLNRNDQVLGLIDKTGFTLEQRMFLTEPELQRYYGPSQVGEIRSLQELWDESLIVGHILHWSRKRQGMNEKSLRETIKETRAYQQFAERAAAMNTSQTGEGLELIPTDFSAQILDVVAVSLKVAALFPSVTMPTSPFKLPVATSDDIGFKAPESITDQFLTEANKIGTITPQTTNITFTAQKPGALAVFSEEVNEDSIIAVVPFLRGKLGMAIANARERAILDGDTAGSHQDFDVTSATDARKLWNGIRKDVDPSNNGVDLATFNLTNLRSLRQELDPEFAEDSEQLAYVVSVGTMLKMMEFDELVTVDKFGPNATILRGQVGRLDNIPVLTSKYVREDVTANGVNENGGVNTKTYVVLANRNAYMVGLRRGIQIKMGESIWTDQGIMVVTERLDFQKVRPNKTTAAIGVNITP